MRIEDLILPDFYSLKFKENLYTQYVEDWSTGEVNKYLEPYLFDLRMEKVWRDFDTSVRDTFIQGVVFHLPFQIVRTWLKHDKRSIKSKKITLKTILKNVSHLEILLKENEKILFGLPNNSPFEDKAKVMGRSINKILESKVSTYERLTKDLAYVSSRCQLLVDELTAYKGKANLYFLDEKLASLPDHLDRASAFRNYFIDEMCTYIDGEFNFSKVDLFKVIAEISCVLCAVDTTYDDVRKRHTGLRLQKKEL